MAVQLHVAHSIIISGAAVFAGVRISDCLPNSYLRSQLQLSLYGLSQHLLPLS